MGGRGSFSYSGGGRRADSAPLGSYAVAGLNSGTAKGTSPAAAVARFRERTMSEKFEYSAYIDEAGYIHSLGSTKKEGSTKVAPLSSVAKEKGVTTLIHNIRMEAPTAESGAARFPRRTSPTSRTPIETRAAR